MVTGLLNAHAPVLVRIRFNGLVRSLKVTFGSRCVSGAFCSPSRRVANLVVKSAATKRSSDARDGPLIIVGPQPDTEEEEGSALDFPEVRSEREDSGHRTSS